VLVPLVLFAGFVDATGGGGWGPVATPTLIASGKLDPRKVIGSVSASEFVVTISASLGFLAALGTSGLDWRVVVGLIAGGSSPPRSRRGSCTRCRCPCWVRWSAASS